MLEYDEVYFRDIDSNFFICHSCFDHDGKLTSAAKENLLNFGELITVKDTDWLLLKSDVEFRVAARFMMFVGEERNKAKNMKDINRSMKLDSLTNEECVYLFGLTKSNVYDIQDNPVFGAIPNGLRGDQRKGRITASQKLLIVLFYIRKLG